MKDWTGMKDWKEMKVGEVVIGEKVLAIALD
jgi:hypothetical protein